MNQIESVVRTQKIFWGARNLKVVKLFDEDAEQRFRNAALAYYRACENRPGEQRCKIAFQVAAAHFGQTPAALRSENRKGDLANIRQQLMAFCRVVSLDAKPPNALKSIGRCFHRDHSTVVLAVKKYGDAIIEALK